MMWVKTQTKALSWLNWKREERRDLPRSPRGVLAKKRFIIRLYGLIPAVAFFVYGLWTLHLPEVLIHDEAHYIPAAKALVEGYGNPNFEHPPLGKWIMGKSWQWGQALFATESGSFEFFWFRLPGLLLAAIVILLMPEILCAWGLRRRWALLSGWVLVFDTMWFVQAKTAMLDIYSISFAVISLFLAERFLKAATLNDGISVASSQQQAQFGITQGYKYFPFMGSSLLSGMALASKWSSLPLVGLVFLRVLSGNKRHGMKRAVLFASFMMASYTLSYLPLTQLAVDPLSWSDLPKYHRRMILGLESTSDVRHTYQSVPLQWITLSRPIWYTFAPAPTVRSLQRSPASDTVSGIPQNLDRQDHWCIFMGGNPAIFFFGLLGLGFLAYMSIRKALQKQSNQSPWALLFTLVPLLFWVIVPRKLMFSYYFLSSSIWFGAAVLLSLQQIPVGKRTRGRLAWGWLLLCALYFFVMLPLMDGRPLPLQIFLEYYQPWMLQLRWI